MPYSNMWSALQSSLKGGATIANWTAARGLGGDPFQVEVLDRNSILVTGPGLTAPRPVRRAEFEAMYDVWDAYVRGELSRSQLPTTFHSKYIISLLHWLQERSGGGCLNLSGVPDMR